MHQIRVPISAVSLLGLLASSGLAQTAPAWVRSYNGSAEGSQTSGFCPYQVAAGNETPAAIPLGRGGKLPFKGHKVAVDSPGPVYTIKGSGTFGFWRYDANADSWTQMSSVSVKNAAGDPDLVCVDGDGRRYVRLAKGQKTDSLWHYRIAGDSWEPLQAVPVDLPALKPDAGSWLELVTGSTDGGRSLYLHKAKWQNLYRYSLPADSSPLREKTAKPSTIRPGLSK